MSSPICSRAIMPSQWLHHCSFQSLFLFLHFSYTVFGWVDFRRDGKCKKENGMENWVFFCLGIRRKQGGVENHGENFLLESTNFFLPNREEKQWGKTAPVQFYHNALPKFFFSTWLERSSFFFFFHMTWMFSSLSLSLSLSLSFSFFFFNVTWSNFYIIIIKIII